MTAITDEVIFSDVPLIDITTVAIGGVDGGANMQGKALANRTKYLNALQSSVATATSSAGVITLNAAVASYFTSTLYENVSSIAVSGLSGNSRSLMLRIQQAGVAKTLAFPASFKWASGVEPEISSASGAVDLLAITTFDGGTTWLATLAKAFS